MRVLALLAVAAFVATGSTSAASSSGLRGIVRVPLPVCAVGQPCSKPAEGIKLSFRRDRRVIARVTSGIGGRYHVALPPARYNVTSSSGVGPTAAVTPAHVTVTRGTFRRVDLLVDTGIR